MFQPDPALKFYGDHHHRYMLDGEWLPYSMSQVLSWDMSPPQRAAIERTKDGEDGWKIRGETLHKILSEFLNGEGSIYDDKWTAWVEPLLADDLFKDVTTIATEMPICDRVKRVAGAFDFLIETLASNTETGATSEKRLILGDLKTVSSRKGVSSRKPAKAQLGAYASFLAGSPYRTEVTDVVTVICGPERTRCVFTDVDTAIAEWEEQWGRFQATQPSW